MFFCLKSVLAALIANEIIPNSPNDDNRQGSSCFFYQQEVTDRSEAPITEHTHLSVLLFQLCFIITKPLQILSEFYLLIKAKTLHFFYVKKLKIVQNKKK